MIVMAIDPEHPTCSRMFQSIDHVSKECLGWVLVYATHHDRPGFYSEVEFTKTGVKIGSREYIRIRM